MAQQDAVEILIKARNEANSAIAQAIGQLKVLETQGTKAGSAPRLELARLSTELANLSPATARAAAAFNAIGAAGPSIAAVVPVVGALAAGFAAAFGAARSFSGEVERLSNLKASTGATIENLQVLGEVFKRAGLGADSADQAMLRLNKAIAEQNPLLAKLGITAKDPVEAMLQPLEGVRLEPRPGGEDQDCIRG